MQNYDSYGNVKKTVFFEEKHLVFLFNAHGYKQKQLQ